jgi:hypothetical protein
VAVLCALPVEYAAIRQHVEDLEPFGDPAEVNWERGRFVGQHAEWDLLLVETGAENIPATVETEKVLSSFAPQVGLYVGLPAA